MEDRRAEGRSEVVGWCAAAAAKKEAFVVRNKGIAAATGPGPAVASGTVGVELPAEEDRRRMVRCRLKGWSSQRQPAGCCGSDSEWGKMQESGQEL